MKLYGVLCLTVAIIMIICPLVAVNIERPTGESTTSEYVSDVRTAETTEVHDDTVSVFMTDSKAVEEMELRDYIIGSVSAEVPASYNEEAIKAQALAAVTYVEYRKKHGGYEDIGGADISDDSTVHQGYVTTEEMRENWGDAYDLYYEKIASAVDEVLSKVITYKGEPIMAAYHAISSGKTETAESIWGDDIPYLQSVNSEWDTYSTRFSSEVTVSADELEELFADTKNADFSGDTESWIKIKSTSDTGTVLEAEICGVTMTGTEIRSLLGLRSPVFKVNYSDGEFVFAVSGYGHGVGMSQNGANYMANDGYSYEEIIAHYYPGTEITQR